MARPRASAVEWAKRVRAWRASGQDAAAYAAARGWNPRTLTWWASPAGRARVAPSTKVEFVEVQEERSGGAPHVAPHASVQGGAIEVRLGGTRSIRVESGSDLALLRAVVEVLEAR
jgi:hypothetical protein